MEADNYADGAADGEFADEVETHFRRRPSLNFRGVQRPRSASKRWLETWPGNVGFSDSDPDQPRFINDLGEKEIDPSVPNALGAFSRHIVWLDEIGPVHHQ